MKSFNEYLLCESVFTNREGEYGYVGKSKIIDGEQFQLKNLIKKKLNEIVFSKEKNKVKKFIDQGAGEYYLKISTTKEEKKPSVASTNRFVHTGTLKETLFSIFGDELDQLDFEEQANKLNEKLQTINDINSEEGEKLLDEITDKISKSLNKRPKQLLGSNMKLEHSNIGTLIFKKIGFPAFHSIFYDELEKKWRLLRTCPSAGSCVGLCFGGNGMFIMTSKHAVSGTRVVNYIMNDPDGFVNQLAKEIKAASKTSGKKDKKLYIRVHDVGDFFSEYYFDIFMSLAKKLPDVIFFAYTKSLKLLSMKEKEAGSIPDNFIFNRSEGGVFSKDEKLEDNTDATEFFNREVHKHSTIIRRIFFENDPQLKKIQLPKISMLNYMNSDKNLSSEEKWKILKEFITKRYKLKSESLVNYQEFLEIFHKLDQKNPVNVIVFPGDGDISATTKGVLGTYLIEH